jgi:hypothetical protein
MDSGFSKKPSREVVRRKEKKLKPQTPNPKIKTLKT